MNFVKSGINHYVTGLTGHPEIIIDIDGKIIELVVINSCRCSLNI